MQTFSAYYLYKLHVNNLQIHNLSENVCRSYDMQTNQAWGMKMIWILLTILVVFLPTKLLIWQSIKDGRSMTIAERELYRLEVMEELSRGQSTSPQEVPDILADVLLGKPAYNGRGGFEKPTVQDWILEHDPQSPLAEQMTRENEEMIRQPLLRMDVDHPSSVDELGLP